MGTLTRFSESHLMLQKRVPEGFSATQSEHKWHNAGQRDSVVKVTDKTAVEARVLAEDMLTKNPSRDRKDEEFRVVLRTTETTDWVVME